MAFASHSAIVVQPTYLPSSTFIFSPPVLTPTPTTTGRRAKRYKRIVCNIGPAMRSMLRSRLCITFEVNLQRRWEAAAGAESACTSLGGPHSRFEILSHEVRCCRARL